jgi:hypothetical protein
MDLHKNYVNRNALYVFLTFKRYSNKQVQISPYPAAFENVSILASIREQRKHLKKDRAIFLVAGITDMRK